MKSQRSLLRAALGGLAVASLGLLAVPRDAQACGHFMAEERIKLAPHHEMLVGKVEQPHQKAPSKVAPVLGEGEQIASLATAEDAIAKNQPAQAARLLGQIYPNLVAGTPRQGPSVSRALEMLAVSVVRANGAIEDAGLASRTPDQRMDWAKATLFRVVEVRSDDMRAKGHLGEAFDAVGDHVAAKSMLEELATADVLPTAQGFAVLARLRSAVGESDGAADAESRCRAMSKGAGFCARAAKKG